MEEGSYRNLEQFNEIECKQSFNNAVGWGLITGIDLHSCNPELIRDANKIKKFVIQLCEIIEMKRFGECVIVDFGEDPAVSGFSMTQLIETSLISGHFVNQTNNIYLDIFSCKYYNPKLAVKLAIDFFQAKDYTFHCQIRK
jgi:S-adenosylmethionine/arginine decarboxylase-like enzyme